MSQFNHEIEPPTMLEERVVAALWSRGLLKPSRSTRGVAVAAAAAAIVFISAGYAAGRWHAQNLPVAVVTAPQFMLLLHDTPTMAASTVPEHDRVEQYRRWAQQVDAGGHAIRGEKLKDIPGQTLGGFFIVDAPSLDAARAIAETCPHARLGGRIEIREIDPT